MKAVKAQELLIKMENKIGVLAQLTELLSGAGINIRAVSAWAVESEAFFRLITSDNASTKEVLEKNSYSFQEKEVVVVELLDEVGQLGSLASKLKAAGIDLTYIYATASKPNVGVIVILSSSDNDKALEVLGA